MQNSNAKSDSRLVITTILKTFSKIAIATARYLRILIKHLNSANVAFEIPKVKLSYI